MEHISPEQTRAETLQAIQDVGCLFGGTQFLTEIARAESNIGTHPDTFKPGYFGGPMQVDDVGFAETKNVESHPKLLKHYKKIKDAIGLDWNQVQWENLTNPFLSVLAARLLLLTKDPPFPDTLEGRAKYWKEHYNTEKGSGTVKHFLEANSGASLRR